MGYLVLREEYYLNCEEQAYIWVPVKVFMEEKKAKEYISEQIYVHDEPEDGFDIQEVEVIF